MKAKVFLYISMSLDGYLAGPNDDLSWLDEIDHGENDYNYHSFTEKIDAYIIGRKTYDVVKKLTGGVFEQAEKFECYILTRQERENENGATFYNGAISDLINTLKNERKNIYCDGGAEIVKALIEKDLIDEYIVSIIPVLLGEGTRLFLGNTPKLKLKAMPSEQFDSGVVQVRYVRA